MITSRDRILTTHVGSLPRNDTITDLLIKREAGETIDARKLVGKWQPMGAKKDDDLSMVFEFTKDGKVALTYTPLRMVKCRDEGGH